MLRRRPRTLLFSLVFLAAALPACRKKPLPPAYVAGARKVLLVGIDGADWSAIDPLIAAGRLPTLARLKAAGNAATLVATPPLVSPIIWTTIATGRTPDEHGVLDFMVDLPGGGQGPVGSVQRKVPALWTMMSASGRRVGVVGWWATWPAETVNGTIVSDQLAPQLTRTAPDLGPGLVSPASASDAMLSMLVQPSQIQLELLRKFAPVSEAEYGTAFDGAPAARFYSNRTAHLAAILAGTYTYMAMGERLLSEQPDFTAVYLEAVDSVSHRFVNDPASGRLAIEQAYVEVDTALGRLAAAAPRDTWVIVCSDHGFYAADAGVKEDPAQLSGPATAWHRPYGMAAAAEAGALVDAASPTPASPAAVPPARGIVTPLDIAPTVLHAAGLPVDPAMTGRAADELLPPGRPASAVVRKAYALPAAAPAAGATRSAAIDEAALARLQALGYVGSRPSSLALQNLGESLYRGGKLDAAERALRSVVESQPGNLAAWLWLARTLHARGRTAEALAAWGEALKLPDGATTALLAAVEAAAAGGREAEGRALIAKASSAPPAVVHTARAVLASAGRRAAEAERELRLALRADPTYFDALFRLFDVYQQSGRAKQAVPLLERAAKAVPGSPRHGALLGEALLAAGDFPGAERALAHALDQAPDSVPVRLDLARAELSHGHADGALETLGPAPPSPERSILMGAASSVLGRWPDAARHYQEALTAREPTPEVLNGLGWALHKQGRNQEAADALRRSLALRADQPQIQKLLETFGS
jgi:tetratricopeptide (TPR) repeat protein